MSRQPKAIDEKQLKALMRLKPTLADTAAFFECAERTIERHIRDTFDLTFVEFREQNMVHTRLSIVRKAIEKAERGDNVMLIFCLKNLCGWRDRSEMELSELKQPVFNVISGNKSNDPAA
jgi:AraC-like DNA-binding protein